MALTPLKINILKPNQPRCQLVLKRSKNIDFQESYSAFFGEKIFLRNVW